MLVGVYIGTVGVQMLDGADVASPFASILEEIMALGGFSKFVGAVAFVASLAAIMSTADSLIIAVSHLITFEVLYPFTKTTSPTTMTWMGRGVSAFAVVVALIVGIFWDQGISDMGAIQFPLTMQAVPTFLLALFATSKATDVHPWCLATSAWAAAGYIFGAYFGYLRVSDDPAPIDTGITGITIQMVLLVVLESTRRLIFPEAEDLAPLKGTTDKRESSLWYPNRPASDIPCTKRFGDRPLTPQMMWGMMEGVHEPMTNSYFVAFMLLSVSMVTPLVPAGIPTSLEDAVVINGMPWWAFKALLLCLIPYGMSLYAVLRMPNAFPASQKTFTDAPQIAGSMDAGEVKVEPADLVELSRPELGRRTSYDETNTSAAMRRSSIGKSIQGLRASLRGSSSNDSAWKINRHDNFVEGVNVEDDTSRSRGSEDIDC